MTKKNSIIISYLISSLFWCSNASVRPVSEQAILLDEASVVTPDYPLDPHEYGVGFDLTGSYGTVAVSFADGSTFNIAKIEAEPCLKSLLTKWSLESSRHPAPPYRDIIEAIKDEGRQAERRDRKAHGLPASKDVETVSVMLSALRNAAQGFLGHNITRALAATPHLPALYKEDINDAFEFIGLEDLDTANALFPLFRKPNAAAASHGIALCSNYTDLKACEDEYNDMNFQNILSVLYTNDTFWVELTVICPIYYAAPYPASPPTVDFGMGLDKIHDNPSEEHYWERMKDMIYRAVYEGLEVGRRPGVVFVFGEASQNPKFREVLDEALVHMLGEKPKILDDPLVYAPALGAAELAKRGSYW